MPAQTRAERRQLTDGHVLGAEAQRGSESTLDAEEAASDLESTQDRGATPGSRRALRLALAVAAHGPTLSPITDDVRSLTVDGAPALVADEAHADVGSDSSDSDGEDPFERAARTLSFGSAQGAAPRRVPQAPGLVPSVTIPVSDNVKSGRRQRRRVRAQRAVTTTFTIGAMGIVGLFAVSMGTPVAALSATVNPGAPMSIQAIAAEEKTVESEDEIQAFVATSVDTDLNRAEQYQAATTREVAADTGITIQSNLFVNDPNAPVQWPFAVGVPVTDTWGPRWGSFHHGVDFTPGEGADIQAIADGTVRIATEAGGLYGVYVVIDHEIDGRKVSSLYAHMLNGSLKVEVGDEVTVGTVLGNTGNTGLSYGPHTHFEITVDGTRIDPLPWLRTNAGG